MWRASERAPAKDPPADRRADQRDRRDRHHVPREDMSGRIARADRLGAEHGERARGQRGAQASPASPPRSCLAQHDQPRRCGDRLVEQRPRSSRFAVAVYDEHGAARVEIDDYLLTVPRVAATQEQDR